MNLRSLAMRRFRLFLGGEAVSVGGVGGYMGGGLQGRQEEEERGRVGGRGSMLM